MRPVVDTGGAGEWQVVQHNPDVARAWPTGSDEQHTPRPMATEAANALRREARLGGIERGEAGAMAAPVPRMPVRWTADGRVSAGSVRLARPVHDCACLAPAHRIGGAPGAAELRFSHALALTGATAAVVMLADRGR